MKLIFRTKATWAEALRFDGENHDELREFCDRVQTTSIDDEGGAYVLANPRFAGESGTQMLRKDCWLVKMGEHFFMLPDEVFTILFKV